MLSRFAVAEDIFTTAFSNVNKRLLEITNEQGLIDHRHVNEQRFSAWFKKIDCQRSFYGARFWEYPFAILAADLEPGMKCADIGCGTTPFTPYLCEVVSKENVTGFDPDYIPDDHEERHLSFGARKSHIDKFGFAFRQNSFTKLDAPDNSFDRVFCISVLEHIEDPRVKQMGMQEMARILKPGGKLIVTFDTGIDLPLNPPLKIIELSGLVPDDGVNIEWPQHRFVDYGDKCIDVFGLSLRKPTGQIYRSYDQKETVDAYDAMKKYTTLTNWFNVPYNSILKLNDMEKPLGPLRVALKKILKRY